MTPPSGSTARGVRAHGEGDARGRAGPGGRARGERVDHGRARGAGHSRECAHPVRTGAGLRLAAVGAGRPARLQLPLRDGPRRRHRRRPAADLVLQQPRHGHRDARGRRLDPVRGRLVRATSTRSTRRRGSRAGATRRQPHRSGLRRPDRVVGRGRGRRRGRAPCTSPAARRCTPCAPRTARCAGATRSDGPATTTTRPRSSRRRVVVDDMVIFGSDVHNSRDGEPAGVYALDAATGKERWQTTTAPTEGEGSDRRRVRRRVGLGRLSTSSRGLVFVGTGNCTRHRRAGVASRRRWSPSTSTPATCAGRTSPTHRTTTTSTSRARPTSSTANGRKLVGLGNKDGVYYAVDRATGELVWKTQATEPGIDRPGSNFSTGGFIGPTAVRATAIIVGGTAVGGSPSCTHSTPPPARSSGSRPRRGPRTRRPRSPTASCSSAARPTSASAPSTSPPATCSGRRR